MSVILRTAKELYINLRGFHTKQKLVIIESDDWGSIRMPSYDTFKELQRLGDHPEKDAFLSNDALETEDDLNNLLSVLRSVKDSVGNPAVITANFAMANPDFDNIDYKSNSYCYEPFYKTYERFDNRKKNLEIIMNAYNEGVMIPQLHCREHLNIERWMRDLHNLKSDTITAFNNKLIGIGASFTDDNIFGYMDSFNADSIEESNKLTLVLQDAVRIFEDVFSFKSDTFVACCHVWDDNLEKILKQFGITGIQSSEWQNVPAFSKGTSNMKRKIHYTGEIGRNGQIFSVRNCSFEPAYSQNPEESFKKCFLQVKNAFNHHKPAVINSHRLNYIGSINKSNAKNNLLGLKKLLDEIVSEYPDVKFISSRELVKLIKESL